MITVGVFGANSIARQHIEELQQIPGFEIKGIYDPDTETARKVSAECNVSLFSTPESLISSCDALDFELNPQPFFHLLSQILTSSRHLFVNYPVSGSLENINQLSKLAHEANVIIQVGNHERLNPGVQSVLPYLKRPLLIEIRRKMKASRDDQFGKFCEETLIRDIDLAISLNKSNIRRISATGIILRNHPTDLIDIRLEFDNGCVANLTSNRYSDEDSLECHIYQKGIWFLLNLHTKQATIVRSEEILPEGYSSKTPDPIQFEVKEFEPVEKNQGSLELTMFRDSIMNNNPPVAGIEDAALTVSLTLKIQERISKISQS